MKWTAICSMILALLTVCPCANAQTVDFMKLVQTGTAQQVSDALAAGANYNSKDDSDETPLMLAAKYNQDPTVIMALLDAGAELDARDQQGAPAILYAAYNPNPGVFEAILKAGAHLQDLDSDGRTPLMVAAAQNQNPAVIVAMLKAGASLEERDNKGASPLVYAAYSNRNPAIITSLLKAGAKTDAKDKEIMSSLLLAAARNNTPEVVSILLKSKAMVTATDDDGMTPLLLAAAYNPDPAVVSLLLKSGADLKARDNDGRTILMRAAMSNANPDVLVALVQAGAAINARDKDGLTPLMYAVAQNGNPFAVAALLGVGALPNLRDNEGKSAADHAQENPGWAPLGDVDFLDKLRSGLNGFLPVLTTVAGDGRDAAAGDGGPAVRASLSRPSGVAVDSAGDVYFADSLRSCIRKIDTKGIVTTVAGNGTDGDVGKGGIATSVSLYEPRALAFDANGNLYFGTAGAFAPDIAARILKLGTDGIITVVAGGGKGDDGGPASAAGIYVTGTQGIAVDSAGVIYFSEAQCIKKNDAKGVLSTVAGTGTIGFGGDGGPATSAMLDYPAGVAIDVAGNLYVADAGNDRVRRVDPQGIISTVAGGGDGGDDAPATFAHTKSPVGVAVDSSGILYFSSDGRVRTMDAKGVLHTIAGGGGVNLGQACEAGWATSIDIDPRGIAAVAASGIYICDLKGHKVLKVLMR